MNVYNNRGLVNYRSVSDTNTDGAGDSYKSDPTGQPQTSLKGRVGQYPNVGDSDVNPYTVIPGGAAGKALKKEGVGLGDVAISINLEKMEVTTSIIADIGPENKIGENSIRANINMGEKDANHKIDITTPSVVNIIFARSREYFKNKEGSHYTNGKIPTALQVEKLVNQLYRENKANIDVIVKSHTIDYFKK